MMIPFAPGMRFCDELVQLKDKLQSEYLAQNTAKMRLNELAKSTDLTEQGYMKAEG